MSLQSQWKCPYCPTEGTATFSTEAVDALVNHLCEHHLEQHFQAVIARLDKRAFIAGRLSLQLLRGQIRYIDGTVSLIVEEKLELPPQE